MKLNIQSLKFDAGSKLLAYIEEKLGKLNKFYDNIVGADVTMSVAHVSESSSNKVVKMRLEIPGNDLFAEHQAATFEEAIDHTLDVLKKQLLKHKEKQQLSK
jgi:putative sigma-54 modulation protein